MKTCEGDTVETAANLIFDVKGFVHPPNRVIAFIRYFPSSEGKRKKDGTAFGKVYSLSKRYALLRKRFPRYLVYDPVFDETLCEVPIRDVKKMYKPRQKLLKLRGSRKLDLLERRALQLVELLKDEADVPWESIGISGSIMVGLHTADSDIDPIVYGSQNCRKVYSGLEKMFKSGHERIGPYSRENLKTLFDFRSKDTHVGFEDFVRTESRKVSQGKFQGTDYFIRFVKDWPEVDEEYGDVQYKNVGRARINATVTNDSEAIFTPCKYTVEKAKVIEGSAIQPIVEIASFRGRFCEQAKRGETVVAQGKVELVKDNKRNRKYYRLLIGNIPADFMVLKR
jgi:predicted nucleotidyltransferase